MSDMLATGATFLARHLKEHASRTVEYRRGTSTIAELKVTIGTSVMKYTNDQGDLVVFHTDRDYLFTAADLVIDGTLTTPQKGDIIADPTTGETSLYEALRLPNEPPWRYTDGQQ